MRRTRAARKQVQLLKPSNLRAQLVRPVGARTATVPKTPPDDRGFADIVPGNADTSDSPGWLNEVVISHPGEQMRARLAIGATIAATVVGCSSGITRSTARTIEPGPPTTTVVQTGTSIILQTSSTSH